MLSTVYIVKKLLHIWDGKRGGRSLGLAIDPNVMLLDAFFVQHDDFDAFSDALIPLLTKYLKRGKMASYWKYDESQSCLLHAI